MKLTPGRISCPQFIFTYLSPDFVREILPLESVGIEQVVAPLCSLYDLDGGGQPAVHSTHPGRCGLGRGGRGRGGGRCGRRRGRCCGRGGGGTAAQETLDIARG